MHIITDRQKNKIKFPPTSSILSLKRSLGVDEKKTCKHKSKPISATNVAFSSTLGLMVCWMSGPYKTGTFDISTQPNRAEIPYYVLESPEGVQKREWGCGGGRGELCFQNITKGEVGRRLALQIEQ